ncbi:helix-turn-helix domain-containing protein [Rhodanobacter glycinis]|uniref:Helix-turn-helix domain-containing protein n=1 Tax=Rhodanobacter glycinis TaxID=582702 RepID=A0A5B9E326_9GAMM|nr:helix-turn-helix domain-containing protein [Rhodanobacter glycinis]QEE24950.1 helix-turn-helix domain-containing protein [Rhodanobacter glycinis]
MRPVPLQLTALPVIAPSLTPSMPSARYLTNDEAAAFLRLSPRTLEKQRVIGGGPRFRKFGRRVMYAIADLEAWADARSFETTYDSDYAARRASLVARGR